MRASPTSLDLTRLEKVRHHASGKITARCPACAEADADRKGNHLAIFPDGRTYACAAHAGDREHRSRIHALAGLCSDFQPDPEERRRWHEQRTRAQCHDQQRRHLAATARSHREALVARYAWEPVEVWEDSPQRIDGDLVASCPRHFLATLFPADSMLWTGEVHESGRPDHAARWKTCADWLATTERIGPMTTPATWHPGIRSRASNKVLSVPFTILDFDGFDGEAPRSPAERRQWFHDALALVRFLREHQHLHLAALVHTGGKSVHAWFHTPPAAVVDSLRDAAPALGIDAGLIGHPEHPCRLPGHPHAKTGELSRLLWLQLPLHP